jgi:hypothetical protein
VFSFLEILRLMAAMAAALLVELLNRAGYCYPNIFSAHGVPIGAEPERYTPQTRKPGHKPGFLL